MSRHITMQSITLYPSPLDTFRGFFTIMRPKLVAVILMAALLGLMVQLGPASASTSPSTAGSCTYVGLATGTLVNGTNVSAKHYICAGAQETSTTSTSSDGAQPMTSASGNSNYLVTWTSGSCNTLCADTYASISTTMVPNTPYWSDQGNALVYTCGGLWMEYQDVPVIGTSSNSPAYNNQFDIDMFPLYGSSCAIYLTQFSSYNILTGYNLNVPGTTFQTYYTLNSNGVPTWMNLEVTSPSLGGTAYLYSVQLTYHSGYTYSPIWGWTQNVVCSNGGCYTTFTGGSGSLTYYQNNIGTTSPIVFTGENSNCAYSLISIGGGATYGTQTFTC